MFILARFSIKKDRVARLSVRLRKKTFELEIKASLPSPKNCGKQRSGLKQIDEREHIRMLHRPAFVGVPGSDVDRSVAVVVLDVEGGAFVDEQLENLGIGLEDGHVKGSFIGGN